jgi:hypothetical protein
VSVLYSWDVESMVRSHSVSLRHLPHGTSGSTSHEAIHHHKHQTLESAVAPSDASPSCLRLRPLAALCPERHNTPMHGWNIVQAGVRVCVTILTT